MHCILFGIYSNASETQKLNTNVKEKFMSKNDFQYPSGFVTCADDYLLNDNICLCELYAHYFVAYIVASGRNNYRFTKHIGICKHWAYHGRCGNNIESWGQACNYPNVVLTTYIVTAGYDNILQPSIDL